MAESPDDPGAQPGEPSDAPFGALPAASVPRPSESGWQVNWWGFVPLAIVAVLAFVGFRAAGLGGDDPAEAEAAGSPVTRPSTTTIRPRLTTTTVAPTTTTTLAAVPTVPPTTVPAGPAVRAWGEIGPCRFGDTCLAVSFAISGFPEPLPTSFLCVYPNSTRQFTFQGDGELDACLTGDEGDTVYIEVAGVRSGGVSATSLTP